MSVNVQNRSISGHEAVLRRKEAPSKARHAGGDVYKEGEKMLAEERYKTILDALEHKKTLSLGEVCALLGSSESTARRDISYLAKKGLLTRVHGGAVANGGNFFPGERSNEEKSSLSVEEKELIAAYAATLVEEGDFVFLDAGTTTEKMIDRLSCRNVTFVTNAFLHAKKLAQKGYRVFITAGEIKASTEAIVGAECVNCLRNYNFSKCFLGANGISVSGGITTPDANEASVKTAAASSSGKVYVLADSTKFGKVTSVAFLQNGQATVITDRAPDERYFSRFRIKEASL